VPDRGPIGVACHLHRHEALQNLPGHLIVAGQSLGIGTKQVAKESAVDHVNLRRLDLPRSNARAPAGDSANQERRFEQVAIGTDRAMVQSEALSRTAGNEEICRLRCDGAEQTGHLAQLVRIAQLAQVTTQGRLQVAREPRLATTAGTVQSCGVAPGEDAVDERTPPDRGVCDSRRLIGEEGVDKARGGRLYLGLS